MTAFRVGDRVKVETYATVTDIGLRHELGLQLEIEGVKVWFSGDSENFVLTKIVPPRELGSLWVDTSGGVFRYAPDATRQGRPWLSLALGNHWGDEGLAWPIRPLIPGEPEEAR